MFEPEQGFGHRRLYGNASHSKIKLVQKEDTGVEKIKMSYAPLIEHLENSIVKNNNDNTVSIGLDKSVMFSNKIQEVVTVEVDCSENKEVSIVISVIVKDGLKIEKTKKITILIKDLKSVLSSKLPADIEHFDISVDSFLSMLSYQLTLLSTGATMHTNIPAYNSNALALDKLNELNKGSKAKFLFQNGDEFASYSKAFYGNRYVEKALVYAEKLRYADKIKYLKLVKSTGNVAGAIGMISTIYQMGSGNVSIKKGVQI